jgi:FkbM family methyltransferase
MSDRLAEVPLLRDGTFDAAIWTSVHHDYPMLPASFAPGEIVLDLGCHTGALCDLAARRGATVVGYEANFENYALAQINLAGRDTVTLHHAAIWRSDTGEGSRLLFTPNVDTANTGGGSVLFASTDDHWTARPSEGYEPGPPGSALSSHAVDAVALDDVLRELGRVRFLKIDVEGAEFPILLTARGLDMVTAIEGEYHQFTDAEMARLPPSARVGDERYTADLLRRRLTAAGFAVSLVPGPHGRGLFSATRFTTVPPG